MITQSLRIQHIEGNTLRAPDTVHLEGDAKTDFETVVPVGATDTHVGVHLKLAELVLLYLVSDQDLTLKTNSASAPTDTLQLTAGEPLLWRARGGVPLPLKQDVTEFYATNAGKAEATITFKTLSKAAAPTVAATTAADQAKTPADAPVNPPTASNAANPAEGRG
jgi:hypothetical protein